VARDPVDPDVGPAGCGRQQQQPAAAVDDVPIPFVSEAKVEGAPQTRKMIVDKAVLNSQLDDRLFGKPATMTNAIAHPPAAMAASQ